jgi:ethanolamine utilization protein EutA (predicted chaperonin)
MVSSSARFSSADREMVEEDTLRLVSVGVDIGSATSHLVFSRLELEREDTRYVVVGRTVLGESDILLTPYKQGNTIDGDALQRFIDDQYAAAGLRRQDVDTGALILTGVALLRDNARQIADLFAEEAGRFVAVSAGDNLEALMAAHGSGALERTLADPRRIANVDIGGGTTKIAICAGGHPLSLAAVDVGARLVVRDAAGQVVRLEPAGRLAGEAIGLDLAEGQQVTDAQLRDLASYLADRLLVFLQGAPLGPAEQALLRTPPLEGEPPEALVFSGGVSEFIYGREGGQFGDLGPLLAEAVRQRVDRAGLTVLPPAAGIRATVIGASQYTVQVSGSTIFLSPLDAVPVRNVPAIRPRLSLEDDTLEVEAVASAIEDGLRRLDLHTGDSPVALAIDWGGSATFRRIDAFCRGVVQGLQPVLERGHPLVLVFEGDVGGLFGIHLRETLGLTNPVISIDGVELTDFNFVDIGALIPTSGAVPVVIKSLVFRASRG